MDHSSQMNILYSVDDDVVAQTPFIARQGRHCCILNYLYSNAGLCARCTVRYSEM